MGLAPLLRGTERKCWAALPRVLLPRVLPASISPCVSISAVCWGETRCLQKSQCAQPLMLLLSMISGLCAVLTDLFILRASVACSVPCVVAA